jgi:3-dehydroquinate synthase
MRTFKIGQNTDVFIGRDILRQGLLKPKGRTALITDSHVEKLFGLDLIQHFRKEGWNIELLSFPAGEKHKTRETKAALEDQLLRLNFGRDCTLIALGGGVVTDLVGFTAATFCRGVSFYSIPTTLLGMVDASLGGKTGVNTIYGKNQIGAFYPAHKIIIDLCLLDALPEREWINGMAEIIKYGAIASPALFDMLEQSVEKWAMRDPEFLAEIIFQSIQIKKSVVEEDPQETGLRAVLNFGHTIGHALETMTGYALSHGEAIALGMIVESWMSQQLGLLNSAEMMRLHCLFKKYNFSLTWPDPFDADSFKEALSRDKKAKDAEPRFVLLKAIGSVIEEHCRKVPSELIYAGLKHAKL